MKREKELPWRLEKMVKQEEAAMGIPWVKRKRHSMRREVKRWEANRGWRWSELMEAKKTCLSLNGFQHEK